MDRTILPRCFICNLSSCVQIDSSIPLIQMYSPLKLFSCCLIMILTAFVLYVTTDRGHVFAFGDNKMAQLGLGHQSPFIPSPTRIQYRGPPIRRVACGAEFCMIIDVRGNIYSFGCPENGQLGTITVTQINTTCRGLSHSQPFGR